MQGQNKSHSGKWALIIGGSQGMGLASAQKLAAEGFNLCIIYRERKADEANFNKELEELQSHGTKCISFNADALKEEVIAQVISKLKEEGVHIDLMLHSIAKGNLKLMAAVKNADLLPPDLQNVFGSETNFLREDDFLLTSQAMAVSYYNWAKALLDNKLFSPKASCVALSSEGGKKAWRNYAAVGAAKAMLESISRSMALEFAQYGLRSNIIQAGITDTRSLRMIPGSDFLLKQSIQRNPYGRLTKVEDVAKVVYLLALPESEWINGAVIPVDGGESIV